MIKDMQTLTQPIAKSFAIILFKNLVIRLLLYAFSIDQLPTFDLPIRSVLFLKN